MRADEKMGELGEFVVRRLQVEMWKGREDLY